MNLTELSQLINRPLAELYQYVEQGLIPETNITEEHIRAINPMFQMPESTEPETITVAEAAKRSGLAEVTIYKKMMAGEIEYKQEGRRKLPYADTVPTREDSQVNRVEIIDKWMEEDPALRLHVLQKYGIEEILFRLDRLERIHYPEYNIAYHKEDFDTEHISKAINEYIDDFHSYD